MTTFIKIISAVSLALFVACASGTAPKAESPSAGGKNAIGGGCASDTDCQAGLFCEKNDPGGQCLKKCASSADCGPGAVCNDEKKCYKACQSTADCGRPGYACVGEGPSKLCDVAEEAEHK